MVGNNFIWSSSALFSSNYIPHYWAFILSYSIFISILHIALLACVLRKSDIEILLKVWPQFRLKTRGVVLAASYFVFFSQVSPISYFKCTSLDFKSLRGHSRMKLRRLSLRPLFCHNNFTFSLFHIILRKYRCCWMWVTDRNPPRDPREKDGCSRSRRWHGIQL